MKLGSSLLRESADDLTLAVIASSNAPVLLLDASLSVIALSDSFCASFGIDRAEATGKKIWNLGEGEWDVTPLRWLLKATAAGTGDVDAYEMELNRRGEQSRCLVVNARKLRYFDSANVRLVASMIDMTEARRSERVKDNLLSEKGILLQELQHRVANSLQIIASVLMQGARKVRSSKARSHLNDAHNRVLSVAALQRQLEASRLGDVELRTYFTNLCSSIEASMIGDRNRIGLDVNIDESVTRADDAVSLGLITTELVINAIKHAFPKRRNGKIQVEHWSSGPAWTLSVRDTGVGFPGHHGRLGLGTGIVEALAQQLGASVRIEDAAPGTRVSVVHASG